MMKRNKITLFRLICLAISFFILTYGAYFLGEKASIILPVFSCDYVGSGTATGICKLIVDFDDFFNTGFLTMAISMILSIVGVLVFGRLWCGYVCPFGFLQDVLTIIRQKLKIPSTHIPERAKPYFHLLKWLVLLLFVFGIGFCDLCPVQYIMPSLAGFTMSFDVVGMILAGIIVGICFLSDRAFCRYCPLGTLMGFCNKKSAAKIKKNGSACTHCRACLEVCPMNIQSIYENRENLDVTHPDCIYCMKCIEVCPENDALYLELFGKKTLTAKRKTR